MIVLLFVKWDLTYDLSFVRGELRKFLKKNIKIFYGKPLIAYSIESAKLSGSVDRVIVSIDDNEIADILKSYCAEVIMRLGSLATVTSPYLSIYCHRSRQ